MEPTERRRILVMSDLHMTGGKNPKSGVWSATEDFFSDEEFGHFLGYFSDGIPTTLIINGDLFDFLQVLEFPEEAEGKHPKDTIYTVHRSCRGRDYTYTIAEEDINRRYGLRCTEDAMAFVTGIIVEGHVPFFMAMLAFIRHEGNRIIITKGNHDIQLFWHRVQEEIHRRMESLCNEGEPTAFVRERLRFVPWFYYEPGLVWVEHGNQYEYTTSFMNFMTPELPFDFEGTGRQIELDLSSFLVRYLTNRGEPIDPLADNIRPLTRYWSVMWREHPFIVVTVAWTALKFVGKAFAKAVQMKMRPKVKGVADANMKAMKDAAEEVHRCYPTVDSARFFDDLKAFDDCKAEPTLAQGPFPFIWFVIRGGVFNLLWVAPLMIAGYFATKIVGMPEEAGLFQSFLIRLGQGAIVVICAMILFSLRYHLNRARHHRSVKVSSRKTAAPEGAVPVVPPKLSGNTNLDMREMSRFIADRLGVKYVTFGHTHYTDLKSLGDDRWYFNTGTWMTILAEKEQLYRDARQLTFLRIEVDATGGSQADLLCWYPPRREPQRVVVVDLIEPNDSIENGILSFILSKLPLP